jgi:glucose uptake protein
MFVVTTLGVAIACCIWTMLGWGSWANTQKLAGKEKLPFQLYYWDYAIGVFALAVILMATLGSFGSAGVGALENLRQADSTACGHALLSGLLFNVSNILLVVAIDAAGMAVAFPIGVGLALVIGTVLTFLQTPKGDPALLFGGVALVVVAMVLSGIAHSRLPAKTERGSGRGVGFAALAGAMMGFFYPELMRSVSANFHAVPIGAGKLTPYTALLFFGAGVLASNVVVNTLFMRAARLRYADYFAAGFRMHSLGFLGGLIWMSALALNVLASGIAGPAISYALGQGATLVAALWGVVIWKEFAGAPRGVTPLVICMLVGYATGLTLIGFATL